MYETINNWHFVRSVLRWPRFIAQTSSRQKGRNDFTTLCWWKWPYPWSQRLTPVPILIYNEIYETFFLWKLLQHQTLHMIVCPLGSFCVTVSFLLPINPKGAHRPGIPVWQNIYLTPTTLRETECPEADGCYEVTLAIFWNSKNVAPILPVKQRRKQMTYFRQGSFIAMRCGKGTLALQTDYSRHCINTAMGVLDTKRTQ